MRPPARRVRQRRGRSRRGRGAVMVVWRSWRDWAGVVALAAPDCPRLLCPTRGLIGHTKGGEGESERITGLLHRIARFA